MHVFQRRKVEPDGRGLGQGAGEPVHGLDLVLADVVEPGNDVVQQGQIRLGKRFDVLGLAFDGLGETDDLDQLVGARRQNPFELRQTLRGLVDLRDVCYQADRQQGHHFIDQLFLERQQVQPLFLLVEHIKRKHLGLAGVGTGDVVVVRNFEIVMNPVAGLKIHRAEFPGVPVLDVFLVPLDALNGFTLNAAFGIDDQIDFMDAEIILAFVEKLDLVVQVVDRFGVGQENNDFWGLIAVEGDRVSLRQQSFLSLRRFEAKLVKTGFLDHEPSSNFRPVVDGHGKVVLAVEDQRSALHRNVDVPLQHHLGSGKHLDFAVGRIFGDRFHPGVRRVIEGQL